MTEKVLLDASQQALPQKSSREKWRILIAAAILVILGLAGSGIVYFWNSNLIELPALLKDKKTEAFAYYLGQDVVESLHAHGFTAVSKENDLFMIYESGIQDSETYSKFRWYSQSGGRSLDVPEVQQQGHLQVFALDSEEFAKFWRDYQEQLAKEHGYTDSVRHFQHRNVVINYFIKEPGGKPYVDRSSEIPKALEDAISATTFDSVTTHDGAIVINLTRCKQGFTWESQDRSVSVKLEGQKGDTKEKCAFAVEGEIQDNDGEKVLDIQFTCTLPIQRGAVELDMYDVYAAYGRKASHPLEEFCDFGNIKEQFNEIFKGGRETGI